MFLMFAQYGPRYAMVTRATCDLHARAARITHTNGGALCGRKVGLRHGPRQSWSSLRRQGSGLMALALTSTAAPRLGINGVLGDTANIRIFLCWLAACENRTNLTSRGDDDDDDDDPVNASVTTYP